MNDIYKTSDTPFAAYLMLEGYTHLGCVDNGEVSKSGHPRIDHYLTHSEEDIRLKIHEHTNELRDMFQSEPKGFREYYIKLHLAKKKVRSPHTNTGGLSE
jgi:hypothetical protein